MTRRTSFPNLITLRTRIPGANDGRNNQTLTDVDTPEIPARIDTNIETEDIVDRDRATETFQIVIPAIWMGVALAPRAIDAIVIDGLVYELIGNGDICQDHAGRAQNITLVVRRIVG